MTIFKRNQAGYDTRDHSSVISYEYNEASGAQKVTEVGKHLVPLPLPNGTFTTDASTVYGVPQIGKNLAVYNNSDAVGSITLGTDNTVTSLAPGATDAKGNVGIACPPNAYTYIACGKHNFVISSAATLLVYLIYDSTYLQPEALR